MATLAPAEALTDIPCRRCRYNLHGLTLEGRCPECGVDIAESVAAFERWKNRDWWGRVHFDKADPQWLGTIAEGAAISVLGLLIKCATVWLPDSLCTWNQPTRAIPLSLLAIAWVLEALACWKLAAPDPARPARTGVWRLASVRFLATWFALGPLLIPLPEGFPAGQVGLLIALVFVIPGALAGLAASALIFWNLRGIARSFSFLWGLIAVSLAVIAPMCLFISLSPELDASIDSLSELVRTPAVLSGSAFPLAWLRGGLSNVPPLGWLLLLPAAAVLIFELRLLWGLRRFIGQQPASETSSIDTRCRC